MEAFAAVFEELDDPRTGNAKRHLLSEILVIALCTVASGGETCADMALFGQVKQAFLEQFLTLPYGISSHDTFSRVFRLLDPVVLFGEPGLLGGIRTYRDVANLRGSLANLCQTVQAFRDNP